MNFNYSYNNEDADPDLVLNIIDEICDTEVTSIINAINNDFGCSIFSGLIKDMAKKTKDSRGKEKLRATEELKETFRKMINCFPPELLEKHHLRWNADLTLRHDEYVTERYHTPRKLYDLPSNDEIERLWKIKRQERKALQEQVVASGSSLKRRGLDIDVVETICKKLRN